MNPEVSIIIPTYNSEAYIGQALESVFNQTYNNFEVIVVDDASADSTVKVARSFKDNRLKIISNQQNRGVSYGRNRGIEAAKGNWIALLDSDDWYAPQRLEKLLSVAQQKNADLIADNLYLIRDRTLQPWGTLLQENEREFASTQSIDAIDFIKSDRPNSINSKRNWSFGYTKPLIKRDFLIKHGIQYNEAVRVGEDYILYLECLIQQARFVLVPHAYYYYRTRETSLSTRKPTAYLAESCNITQIFINQKANVKNNSQLLQALFENLTIYQQRLAYYQIVEDIKQKRVFKTINQILDRPRILRLLFSRAVGVIQSKLSFILDIKKPTQNEFSMGIVKE